MGKIDQELNRKLQNHFQNFKKEIDNIVSSELNKCMNKKTRFNKNEYIDKLSATTVDVNAGFTTRPKTQSNISEYYEVPIVTTNCKSGPSEIINNKKGGYLSSVSDSEELSKKILFALKYYNLSKKKILFAKKNIDRFLISKNSLKYLEYIEKVFYEKK